MDGLDFEAVAPVGDSMTTLRLPQKAISMNHQPRLATCAALLAALSACTPPPGSEAGPCYGNGTCDDDLTCASNLCVAIPPSGEGEGEGEG